MQKKKYRQYSLEEKRKFAKQFTKSQRESYRAGKRQGFLEGIHKTVKKNSMKTANQRKYSDIEYRNMFTDLRNEKI